MRLENLQQGVLIRRYKRFLADIDFGTSGVETVHCPNPGAMTGLNSSGMRVWCSTSTNPARKLPKTLELVEADGSLVGINTNLPNRLMAEALASGKLSQFSSWNHVQPEYSWKPGTRFDFCLKHQPGDATGLLLEVKNVHLRRDAGSGGAVGSGGGLAEFPDSVTSRGAKHLNHLAEAITEGWQAAMVYIIQRGDCDRFALADDIDPVYAEAFAAARHSGVAAYAFGCSITLQGNTGTLSIDDPLVLDLALKE